MHELIPLLVIILYFAYGTGYGMNQVKKANAYARSGKEIPDSMRKAITAPRLTIAIIAFIWPLTLIGQLIGKLKS